MVYDRKIKRTWTHDQLVTAAKQYLHSLVPGAARISISALAAHYGFSESRLYVAVREEKARQQSSNNEYNKDSPGHSSQSSLSSTDGIINVHVDGYNSTAENIIITKPVRKPRVKYTGENYVNLNNAALEYITAKEQFGKQSKITLEYLASQHGFSVYSLFVAVQRLKGNTSYNNTYRRYSQPSSTSLTLATSTEPSAKSRKVDLSQLPHPCSMVVNAQNTVTLPTNHDQSQNDIIDKKTSSSNQSSVQTPQSDASSGSPQSCQVQSQIEDKPSPAEMFQVKFEYEPSI